MPTKSISDKKLEKIESDKKARAFRREFEMHQKKPQKFDNLKTTTEDKVKGINYYNNLSESEKQIFQRELEKKKIRDSYINYLKYIYKDNYKLTHFHILLATICESVIKRVEKGEKVRLMISCPPQHGKSITLTETLPSWFIGRNPDLRCIITAYNADIAEKFGDRNRQKVKDFGKDLFGIEISDSQDNKTLWDIKDHMGGLFATGLNGSLTSNNGALIIVDDPIKNEIEANNPSTREQVWSNFKSAVLTRQRGNGNAIIVIQTRWHEDDLIGRILNSEVADEWIYVNLPCVWENGVDKLLHRKIGQTLCPEIGYDSEWANSTRKILGARTWNALYQGKPFVEGGEIVKRDFIKFYNKKTVPSVFEELTMSCDLSFGGKNANNDPVGIAIWGRVGGNHYLLDFLIKKLTFTETLERIRYYCGKYPQMKGKIIEAKANGNATMEILNRDIGGFIPYDPKSNSKETRLQLCLPYFESGCVWFPDEETRNDIEEQIQILLKFPKVAHDEIVDITTQYLLNYQYKYEGKINTDNRFSQLAKAIRGLRI